MKFPARSYIPLTENSGAAIARCSFTFASAARTPARAARTSGRESNIVPKSANETADRSTFSNMLSSNTSSRSCPAGAPNNKFNRPLISTNCCSASCRSFRKDKRNNSRRDTSIRDMLPFSSCSLTACKSLPTEVISRSYTLMERDW